MPASRISKSKSRGVAASIRRIPRPTIGQAALVAGLLVVIGLVSARIWGLAGELREVRAARMDLESKRTVLEQRHEDLERQAQFVADPDNLEQELRSRFNYKKPDEHVIVVVPPKDATTTTSTR